MNKLKQFLSLKNKITLQLISVLVAILLWSIVMKNENPIFTRNFTGIPIEVRYENYINEQNLSVRKKEELTCDVKVEGRRNIIGETTADDIKLYVDMREYQKNQKFTIHYTLPTGISMNQMSKKSVTLQFGELSEKILPITIQQTGTIPANNMLVDHLTMNADSVKISGVKEKVDQVVSAKAELDLGSLTKNTKRELKIFLLDKEGNEVEGLKLSKKTVLADITLNYFKEVPIELTTTGELPKNVAIRNTILSNRNCVLVGPKDHLDTITAIKTQVISLNDITGNITIPLQLKLPNHVKLKDNEEFTVSFELDGNIEKNYTLSNENISFIHAEDADVEILNDYEFTIQISGPQEKLDVLKEKDIHLTVDLKQAQKGEGTYPVTVDPIDGVIVKQLTPRVIDLNIK